MLYKKTVVNFLGLLISVIVLFVLTVYLRDPYMLLHKRWKDDGKFYHNLRVQNYGIVKYVPFDSVVIGTSMLENTSSKEAGEKLGGEWVNLSMPGASHYEKVLVANFAIGTKSIKRVIMSVDGWYGSYKVVNNTFEPDLYTSGDLAAKMKVYMTTKALKCIFFGRHCGMRKLDLDRPSAWYDDESHKNRFGGFQNWISAYPENEQIRDVFKLLLGQPKDISRNYANERDLIIQNLIVPMVEKSDTQFDLLISPYSVLYWAMDKQKFDIFMADYEKLIVAMQPYENVNVYWFYDEPFVFDIATYKDLTHYRHTINSFMLDAIKNKTHTINVHNYKFKMKAFRDKVLRFDMEPYLERVRNAVNKQ